MGLGPQRTQTIGDRLPIMQLLILSYIPHRNALHLARFVTLQKSLRQTQTTTTTPRRCTVHCGDQVLQELTKRLTCARLPSRMLVEHPQLQFNYPLVESNNISFGNVSLPSPPKWIPSTFVNFQHVRNPWSHF